MNLKFAILAIWLAVMNGNGTAEKEDNFDEETIGGCCEQIMKNKNDTTGKFNFNSEMVICVFEKAFEPVSGLLPKIRISKFEENNKMPQWNNFHGTSFISPMHVVPDLDSELERALAPLNHPNFPFNYAGFDAPGFPFNHQPQMHFHQPQMHFPRPGGLPPPRNVGLPGHPQYPMRTMQPQPRPMNLQPQRMNTQTQPPQHQTPRRSPRTTHNYQLHQQTISSSGYYGGSSVMSNGGSSVISNGRSSVISNNGYEMTLEGEKCKMCDKIKKMCLEVDFNSEVDYSKCKEPESDADCPAFVDELRQVRAKSAR